MSAFRSALARARGLGSSRSGTEHWWLQKVTALANIPLLLWAACEFLQFAAGGAGYGDIISWLREPLHAFIMTLMIGNLFYHAYLGIQVVIEDYVHCEISKFAGLIICKFGCLFAASAGIFSILSIYFKG